MKHEDTRGADRRRTAVVALVLVAVAAWVWTSTVGVVGMAAGLVATYFAVWATWAVVAPAGPRRTLVRGLAVTLAVGLPLGLAEVPALLGVVDYRILLGNVPLSPVRSPLFRVDERGLYRRHPHAHLTGTAVGGDFAKVYVVDDPREHELDCHYDANGFRNDRDLVRADIAVIGDSFVEAAFVPRHASLTGRMATDLGCEVANLGLIGYGPDRQALVLRDYALPLSPRLVVWVFFEGNDLSDVHVFADPRGREEALLERSRLRHRLLTRNLVAILREATGGLSRPDGRTRVGMVPDGSGGRDATYFLYAGRPLDEHAHNALTHFGRVFADAESATRAAGGRMVLVFAPMKYRVYREVAEFRDDVDPVQWSLSDLPVRLRDIAARTGDGVPFVDLTDALRTAAETGPVYNVADSHWNERGHEVAAGVVVEAVRPLLGR